MIRPVQKKYTNCKYKKIEIASNTPYRVITKVPKDPERTKTF